MSFQLAIPRFIIELHCLFPNTLFREKSKRNNLAIVSLSAGFLFYSYSRCSRTPFEPDLASFLCTFPTLGTFEDGFTFNPFLSVAIERGEG